jgi:hypothetical protein
MMTNKQHDDAWLDVMTIRIPQIADSLRRANGLAIAKELFTTGAMDDWNYTAVLLQFAKLEGFDFSDNIKKNEKAC